MVAIPWRFESSREHFFLLALKPEADQDQNPRYVHDAFSRIASRYVLTNHLLSGGIDIVWRKRVARLVKEENPQNILDVATGSGDLAAEIQKACPDATVVGADFCQPMLENARKRNLEHLIVANGMELPFSADSFDVITIGYGLRNMENWAAALQEFSRVLKPGGKLVILDFSLPTNPVLRFLYRGYLHRVLPVFAGMLTGSADAYRYLGDSIERFPAGGDMGNLLEENGFCRFEAFPLFGGVSSIYSVFRA